MADVTANAQVIYQEGDGFRVVLYRIRNVDTTDTVSVAGKFASTDIAIAFSASDKSEITVTGEPALTLTLTLAGVADDTVYMLVLGQAAV